MRAAEAASPLRITRQSERKSLELFQIIAALASVTLPIGGRDRVAGLQLNPPMTAEGESGRRPRTQPAPKLDPRFRRDDKPRSPDRRGHRGPSAHARIAAAAAIRRRFLGCENSDRNGLSRARESAPPAAVETLDSPFQSEKVLSPRDRRRITADGKGGGRRKAPCLAPARRRSRRTHRVDS